MSASADCPIFSTAAALRSPGFSSRSWRHGSSRTGPSSFQNRSSRTSKRIGLPPLAKRLLCAHAPQVYLRMRILLASSEVHPYSKSGGLADMAGALEKGRGRAGHRVGIVTPLYRGIRDRFPDLQPLPWNMDLPLGIRRQRADVWTLEHSPGVTVYFIDQPEYFDRPALYTEQGADYADNGERFIFFSKAVVHLARYLPWRPEVLHVHDWQTALVPILVLHQRLTDGWVRVPQTCLTIHNLAYQGVFTRPQYDLTNLPLDYFNPNGLEFYGYMNCLKGGILYSDTITT